MHEKIAKNVKKRLLLVGSIKVVLAQIRLPDSGIAAFAPTARNIDSIVIPVMILVTLHLQYFKLIIYIPPYDK